MTIKKIIILIFISLTGLSKVLASLDSEPKESFTKIPTICSFLGFDFTQCLFTSSGSCCTYQFNYKSVPGTAGYYPTLTSSTSQITIDYGDGSPNEVINAPITFPLALTKSHQYCSAGSFVVTITTNAFTSCGFPFTYVHSLSVNAPCSSPVAACTPFNSSMQACPNALLFFDATNCTAGLNYTWDFGDGSPVSNGLYQSHYYPTAGNFLVTATALPNCSGPPVIVKTVNVSIAPPACVPAVATAQGGCQNTILNFNTSNCNSSLVYTWNFGDGTSNTTGLTAAHSYANPGNYIITVTTIDNCSAQTVIAQTINVDVTSCPPPPPPCSDCISSFAPIPGKKYLLSAWAKEKNPVQSKTSYTFPSINVLYPSISGSAGPFAPSGAIIDGWQRIEGEFTIPANATDLTVKINCSTSDCYFDDVRVLPFDGSMKSYVYDPVNMRLVAELDERNYATLYEYDEEGKLIRVKKETEKGKMTIQENRSNTKK
jgi:PKD repeat protein